ncbi:MAG: hypothetical protein ACOX4G_02885 [Limnochordia bacterium]|jgi:hypothetical protein
MKRWWTMVGKEWRDTWTLLAVAIAAVIALDVWLGIKSPKWSSLRDVGVVLSCIPFAGVGIATVVAGFSTMRAEWRSRTSMRTLSYPMSGTGLLTAKLAVILFNLVLVTLVAVAGVLYVTSRTPGSAGMMVIAPTGGIWITILAMSGIAFMIAVGMFSFVIGTLVPRVSGLIAVIVHVLVWYLCLAFGPHVMYIASFLPNPVTAKSVNDLDPVRGIAVPLLPVWPALAATVALLIVAGKILESEVDA